MAEPRPSDLGEAIQEVTEKVQLLVREEIALAKAEMTVKTQRLVKGAVFGIVAGVFALFALIYLLHAASWALWSLLGSGTNYWLGFLITGVVILVLGLIIGLVARSMIKKGSPPKPEMALEEAQLIKGTLTASPASQTVGPVGAREAPAEVTR
jgi:uncharacterized membrane protein YqjE